MELSNLQMAKESMYSLEGKEYTNTQGAIHTQTLYRHSRESSSSPAGRVLLSGPGKQIEAQPIAGAKQMRAPHAGQPAGRGKKNKI
mgnify:CR=1 FL=1